MSNSVVYPSNVLMYLYTKLVCNLAKNGRTVLLFYPWQDKLYASYKGNFKLYDRFTESHLVVLRWIMLSKALLSNIQGIKMFNKILFKDIVDLNNALIEVENDAYLVKCTANPSKILGLDY